MGPAQINNNRQQIVCFEHGIKHGTSSSTKAGKTHHEGANDIMQMNTDIDIPLSSKIIWCCVRKEDG
jgi:hypothetical protein